MITAVDTNILIDILEPDPQYGPASKLALQRCRQAGALVVCDVVWAEVAVAFAHAPEKLLEAMQLMEIDFSPMDRAAAHKASICWHEYLSQDGGGKRIAADFLIGGHALIQCDRLLTRDTRFYRNHFTDLTIVAL